MLTKESIFNIQRVPKENDITLKTIQEFYEEYICVNEYHYILEDGTKIELVFETDKLCHLLAVHYFAPNKNLEYKYKSRRGYEAIKNGEITFGKLKKLNKKAFLKYKERILYFVFLYQLLNNSQCVLFDKTLVNGVCKMDLRFLMYDEYSNTYIHLGLNTENGNEKYFPQTFFIAMGKNKGKYIDNQRQLKIVSRQVIPLNLKEEVAVVKEGKISDT